MPASPITHLRHAAEAVPDLPAAVSFYRDTWGLTVVAQDSGVAFLAAEGSTEPYVLRLRSSAEKHLDLLSLGVADRATVDRLASELATAGVRIDRDPQTLDTPGGGYGFRAFDPDGRLLEISADVEGRVARPLEPGEAIPRGLSHIVINSPDISVTRAFYQERLGFAVSDWLADFMCFLRIDDMHHVLAITSAPHSSLNHVAFDMRGLDEYLRGTGKLIRAGIRPVWGPGRHVPGNNTFSYFVDPNGFVAEYTSELERIDPDSWVPHVYGTGPEESDQWGTGGPFEEFLPHAINEPDRLIWTPSPI
jgi:catechol 2,3-dioxygenase-like lactoylglutathione lyase family enzyme